MRPKPPRTEAGLAALAAALPVTRLSGSMASGGGPAAVPTGFAALSDRLPGGGWPSSALTELVCEAEGVGELGLVMPALAGLTARERWVVWIAPPYVPYAPALLHQGVDLARVMLIECGGGESLWAAEQVLRNRGAGAVLLWPGGGLDGRRLRRLQLAAEHGESLAFVFTHGRPAGSSPAALRLGLKPVPRGLQVEVLKCRGTNAGARCVLEVPPGAHPSGMQHDACQSS